MTAIPGGRPKKVTMKPSEKSPGGRLGLRAVSPTEPQASSARHEGCHLCIKSQREGHRHMQLARLRDRAHFSTRSRSVKGPTAEPRRLTTSGIAAFGRTPQRVNQHRGRSAERIGIRRKTHFRRDVLARREGELAFVPRARPSRRRQAPGHPPKVRLKRRRACCCMTAPATHRGW